MTIYEAAPGIFAIVIAIGSYAYVKITHDRAVAARDARRAARQLPAE